MTRQLGLPIPNHVLSTGQFRPGAALGTWNQLDMAQSEMVHNPATYIRSLETVKAANQMPELGAQLDSEDLHMDLRRARDLDLIERHANQRIGHQGRLF